MRAKRKPPKPDPTCYWSEEFQTWLWPDDRTPGQREADDLAEKASVSGDWERFGFRLVRSARVDRKPVRRAKKKRAQ